MRTRRTHARRVATRRLALACVTVALAAASFLGASMRPDAGRPVTEPGAFSESFRAPVDYATAARYALDGPVEDRPHAGGYHRESQFGQWRKQGGDCQYATTRDLILQRDLDNVRFKTGCRVAAGEFHDPYTGRDIRFLRGPDTSPLVQIDHVVSVHDAWASGLWSPDRAGERADYYNDPEVLQAADGRSNQAKGDGIDWQAATDPVWMPDNKAWHCDYMAKRAYIKHKYRLTMSTAEQNQTVNTLQACTTGADGQ